MASKNIHKKIAASFLQLVTKGDIDEAYQKYVDMNGKHHNLYFSAGFPSLAHAMKENHKQFPHKQFALKHIIADGDLVITHSHVILKPGKSVIIAVHIFKFANNKIVELWDCGQPIKND